MDGARLSHGGPPRVRATPTRAVRGGACAGEIMLYRIVAFLFVALALANAQEDGAPAANDPCLAEDYAEANCARSAARVHY